MSLLISTYSDKTSTHKTDLAVEAEHAISTRFEKLSIDDAIFFLSVISLFNKDVMIKDKMDDMRKDQADIKDLRDMITAINKYKDKDTAIKIDAKTAGDIIKKYPDFEWPAGHTKPTTVTGNNTKETGEIQLPAPTGDTGEKKEANNALLKQITDKLDNKIKDTNTNVEMKNLELQRLMTQRSQVIDITTQIQKKADDSRASIIRNI